jgi:hypothetical protein
VDDPGTPEDESKRIVVTAVSGQSFTSNPGQSLTGDNTGGSSFGTRDPGVIGFYEIPVPAGTYTVYVDNIRSEFTGGSSVGPLDPPAPFFFPEFWNQSESSSDNSDTRDPITIVAGETVSDINFILNNTPPRFDQFEDESASHDRSLSNESVFQLVRWLDRRRA